MIATYINIFVAFSNLISQKKMMQPLLDTKVLVYSYTQSWSLSHHTVSYAIIYTTAGNASTME